MDNDVTTIHGLNELKNIKYDVDSYILLLRSLIPVKCTDIYRFVYNNDPLVDCENKKLTKQLKAIHVEQNFVNFD